MLNLVKTEEKYVRCLKCDKGLLKTPEPTEHINHEGVTVFGVNVADYAYIIDNFKDQGIGPVCKSHTRDDISIVPERKLYLND